MPKDQSKSAILAGIRAAREKNTNYKTEIQDDDILISMTEDDYALERKKRQEESIVQDGGEYQDDGRDVYEESDDDGELQQKNNKRKKPMKNRNVKRQKSELLPNRLMTRKSSTTKKQSTKEDYMNFDDIVAQLTNVPHKNNDNAKDSAKKNKSKQITDKNIFVKTETPFRFKIDQQTPDKTPAPPPVTVKVPIVSAPILLASDCEEMESIDKCSEDNVDEPVPFVLSKSEFDEFSDVDFDEPMDEPIVNNQGFSATVDKVQAPNVDWHNDIEQPNTPNDLCDDTSSVVKFDDEVKKQIYWLDVYQDSNIPGVVFLFGKTYCENSKKFENCTVKISGLERRIFVLPKENFSLENVYNEMKTVLNRRNITNFKTKTSTKKYAFQLVDVPDEADYAMILYDAKEPALPKDLTGESFSHIFGCETSILELMILDLKLKGPCWLNFSAIEPSPKPFSVCKYDFLVQGLKGISRCIQSLPNPPLKLISISIKTIVNSETKTNEIVSIGCFVHNEVYFDKPPPANVFQQHFTLLTQPKNSILPYDLRQKMQTEKWKKYSDTLKIECNERALISNMLARLHRLDPDIIVGHSLFGQQLQTLLQRCQRLNIPNWHLLGRLRRNISLPKTITGWQERMVTAGRLVCDVEHSGKELVKCRSYELPEMIKEVLPARLHGLQNLCSTVPGDLSSLYASSDETRLLLDLVMDESLAAIYLLHELQVLPLAYQITAICGNLICGTLSGNKSERNEYLLLHAFTDKGYITPDKRSTNQKQIESLVTNDGNEDAPTTGKHKPTYLGGLVLEPKKGFYENFILLMDFNSLYPSIIQELNVCFTTIDRRIYLGNDNAEGGADINKMMEEAANSSDKPLGILPTEIRKLIDSRKQVKALLNAPNLSREKIMQYDIRQKALKITANSMYGCLGFINSRFQATPLAALITYKGRDILQRTKQLVESGGITCKVNNVPTKLNLEIVYGDTDSVMVNTGLSNLSDFDTVMAFGRRIKEEVNKGYKNIQLDIDGVFRRLLLFKKKKYAALTIAKNPKTSKLETKQELKGLDIVRRDWCKLAAVVGREVVTRILEGEMSREDLVLSVSEYLASVSRSVREGKEVLDQFVITMGLTRNPESYANPPPHVQVALRHNKTGAAKRFRAKDTIEYVICTDGSGLSATHRAYSPSEVLKNRETLQIDCEYYLGHQLHPVVSRLTDVIDGLNPASVANSLGLDPAGFHKAVAKAAALDNGNVHDEEDRAMSGIDKYKCCHPLLIRCLHCQHENEISAPLASTPSTPCRSCKADLLGTDHLNHVLNTVARSIRSYVKQYYRAEYECQDLFCGYRCRELPVVAAPTLRSSSCLDQCGHWICPRCALGTMKPLLDHGDLYNQIHYFKTLFAGEKIAFFSAIRLHIDSVLTRSAYATVKFGDFSRLFKGLINTEA